MQCLRGREGNARRCSHPASAGAGARRTLWKTKFDVRSVTIQRMGGPGPTQLTSLLTRSLVSGARSRINDHVRPRDEGCSRVSRSTVSDSLVNELGVLDRRVYSEQSLPRCVGASRSTQFGIHILHCYFLTYPKTTTSTLTRDTRLFLTRVTSDET